MRYDHATEVLLDALKDDSGWPQNRMQRTPEYDTHIPLPPLNRKRSDACDVLVAMPVGASKFYADSIERIASLRKQAMARAKGHQYTTRKVTEDGVHGVRIWRTA